MFNKNGFPELRFGDDLKAPYEQQALMLMTAKTVKSVAEKKRGVSCFITRYPREIKFFNMKRSLKDPRVVFSADLILPGAGESVGSAVREHDGAKLKEALLGSVMFRLYKKRGGVFEDFA